MVDGMDEIVVTHMPTYVKKVHTTSAILITSLIIYHFKYCNIYLLPGPNIITTTTSTTTSPPTTTTTISTTEAVPSSTVTATLVRTTEDFTTAVSPGAHGTFSTNDQLQTTSELTAAEQSSLQDELQTTSELTTAEQSSLQSKYEKGKEYMFLVAELFRTDVSLIQNILS